MAEPPIFFQGMVKELVKWYFVQPQVPFLLGALEIYLSPHVSEKKLFFSCKLVLRTANLLQIAFYYCIDHYQCWAVLW